MSCYLNNTLNNTMNDKNHEKSFNSILTENNLEKNCLEKHQKYFEFLAVEIYKFQNGLSPPIKTKHLQAQKLSRSFRN